MIKNRQKAENPTPDPGRNHNTSNFNSSPNPLEHDVVLGDVLPRAREVLPAEFGRLGAVVELLAVAVLPLPHDEVPRRR